MPKTLIDSVSQKFTAKTISAGSLSIDFTADDSNYYKVDLSEDITSVAISGLPSGEAVTLTIETTQQGSFAISGWPANTQWITGDTPSASDGAETIDLFIITTTDAGATWIGSAVQFFDGADQADIDASIDAHVAQSNPHPQYLTPSELPSTIVSWFTDDISSIDGTYSQSVATQPTDPESSVAATGLSQGVPVKLTQFMREPTFTSPFTWFETSSVIQLDLDSSNNNVEVYVVLGLRKADSTLVPMVTSDKVALSGDRRTYTFNIQIPGPIDVEAGDTSYSEIWIEKSDSGVDPTVTIYMEGNNVSRAVTSSPIATYPEAHASTHEVGGSDLIDHDFLTNAQGYDSHATIDSKMVNKLDDINSESVGDLADVDLTTVVPDQDGQVLVWDQIETKFKVGDSRDIYRRNVKQTINSGLLIGGVMTQNTDTTFDIADGTGVVVDVLDPKNPILEEVEFTGLTNIPITNIATENTTYVFLDLEQNVIQLDYWTGNDLRNYVYLGQIIHSNGIIENIINGPIYTGDSANTTIDLSFVFGTLALNGLELIPVTGEGNELKFGTTAGRVFSYGTMWHLDKQNPNFVDYPLTPERSFSYMNQFGDVQSETFGVETDVNPLVWDDNGNVAAIQGSNSQATIQVVYGLGSEGYVLPGQVVYKSLSEATANLSRYLYNLVRPEILSTAVELGYVVIQKDCLNISDTTKCRYLSSERFWGNSFGVALTGVQGDIAPTLGGDLTTNDNPINFTRFENTGTIDEQILYGTTEIDPDGRIRIQGANGIKLDAPSLELSQASDFAGSFLTVGEGGVITYTSLDQGSVEWKDDVANVTNLGTDIYETIYDVVVDEEFQAGSAAYTIEYDAGGNNRSVSFQLYVNNVLRDQIDSSVSGIQIQTASFPVNEVIASGTPFRIDMSINRTGATIIETGDLTVIKSGSSATASWGSITGTLSDQLDLQLVLDNKMTSLSDDNSPVIGGPLLTNGNTINGLVYPAADGTVGQVMTTDGLGNLTLEDLNISTDTTPTLGGDLEVGDFAIKSTTAGLNNGNVKIEIGNIATQYSEFSISDPANGPLDLLKFHYNTTDYVWDFFGKVIGGNTSSSISDFNNTELITRLAAESTFLTSTLAGDIDAAGKNILDLNLLTLGGSTAGVDATIFYNGNDVVLGGDSGYFSATNDFSNYIRYPATDGTADQVLTTDGAGTASWQTASGGGGGVTESYAPTSWARENTSETNGFFTLLGADAGAQSFSKYKANGSEIEYWVENSAGDWEVGLGKTGEQAHRYWRILAETDFLTNTFFGDVWFTYDNNSIVNADYTGFTPSSNMTGGNAANIWDNDTATTNSVVNGASVVGTWTKYFKADFGENTTVNGFFWSGWVGFVSTGFRLEYSDDDTNWFTYSEKTGIVEGDYSRDASLYVYNYNELSNGTNPNGIQRISILSSSNSDAPLSDYTDAKISLSANSFAGTATSPATGEYFLKSNEGSITWGQPPESNKLKLLNSNPLPSSEPNVTGTNSLAIGIGAEATGNDSLAIGLNATTSANRCITIAARRSTDTATKATRDDSVLVGSMSGWYSIQEDDSVSVGMNTGSKDRSIAIGHEAGGANGGIATGAVCIGDSARTFDQNAQSAVAIGESANSSKNGVAIGSYAKTSSEGGVAIGGLTDTLGNDTIAIGYKTQALNAYDIVIGSDTRYLKYNSFDGKFRLVNDQGTEQFITPSHTTAARPTNAEMGSTVYDSDLLKPIWFNGTNWTDAMGTIV